MLSTSRHDAVIIKGGRVIDPYAGVDETRDVYIHNGCYVDRATPGATEIDATGWIVCPGLLDIHVHLREPGQSHKETIAGGTLAAAVGGFTFVACMPNTRPALDTPEQVAWVLAQARESDACDVGPIAAITQDRAGKKLTHFSALLDAGAVALSDDGDGVENDDVMREAFERACALKAVLIQHCEYKKLSAGGVMHAGDVSRRMDLPGLDPRSEEAMIERDIDLCRQTGGRYHVAHISTAKAVELVRQAKAQGLPVTTEVCPHHLLLTHEACAAGDPNTKMHPPLRTQPDVDACVAGLLDGTIDCIATDHAPHTAEEKAAGFATAPPGIVGLETAVGLAANALIEPGLADWPALIAWFTKNPSAVLGLPQRPIIAGHRANATLIDPSAEWTIDPERFAGRARNTPFGGTAVHGRPVGTIRDDRLRTVCASKA